MNDSCVDGAHFVYFHGTDAIPDTTAEINGLIPTLMVNTTGPIDAECSDVRFAYTVKTDQAPSKAHLAAASIEDLKQQFENDLPTWQ